MLIIAVPLASVVPLPTGVPSGKAISTVPLTIGSPVVLSVTVTLTVVLPTVALTTL